LRFAAFFAAGFLAAVFFLAAGLRFAAFFAAGFLAVVGFLAAAAVSVVVTVVSICVSPFT
jgi:hypothetical protein